MSTRVLQLHGRDPVEIERAKLHRAGYLLIRKYESPITEIIAPMLEEGKLDVEIANDTGIPIAIVREIRASDPQEHRYGWIVKGHVMRLLDEE